MWQIYAGIVLASFIAGGYTHHRWVAYDQAKAAVAASENARKTERENARRDLTALDNYSVTQARNQVAATSRARVVAGVQHDLSAFASAAPASACGPDPRIRILENLLGEGVGLVGEGADHIEAIRAQKQGLIERE